MKELIEKWRSKETIDEVREYNEYYRNGFIAAKGQCANELEEAMKPRPIETAPRFVQIAISAVYSPHHGGCVEYATIDDQGRAWRAFYTNGEFSGWIMLPLPTMDGGEV